MQVSTETQQLFFAEKENTSAFSDPSEKIKPKMHQ
jgi:hypothetical protein